MSLLLNTADRLRKNAQAFPDQAAILEAVPRKRTSEGQLVFNETSFRELDDESEQLAFGFRELGVQPGDKLTLMVPYSARMLKLTFGIVKSGATVVLVDPGMGRTNILNCLEQVNPEGFIGIPIVQVARMLNRRRFCNARFNVTVGKRWFWSGPTYDSVLKRGRESSLKPYATNATDPAAIIFTSGSTGPPKGVLYEHGMFDAQIGMLQEHFQIKPGGIDLAAFPLFGLFNTGLGGTTVIPEMDPTRPADVDPALMVKTIEQLGVTQAFGSPAFWNRVGRYCEEHHLQFPTLRCALSAGAPVPVHVLKRVMKFFTQPEDDIFTPYGATESLPICSIGGREVLNETAQKTSRGAGTCVGKPLDRVQLKIIRLTDEPIANMDEIEELPTGEIGEIIVQAPTTTKEYFHHPEGTKQAKIKEGDIVWHRMGDTGYLDEQGRVWFCGRKAHRVLTESGTLYTIPSESILAEHPQVYRCALVGIGKPGEQVPVLIAEPEEGKFPQSLEGQQQLLRELQEIAAAHELTRSIKHFLLHESLPVDTRHNVKIFREKLVPWAASQLKRS
ncbi:Long-chain-fatty-acid--CoA ligase [Polystyrenella longa]|uniref:Long-chain-fatty-acid--CoA ligase n=1 Tax=Polystyrenella longa TaxID=2528007 RepID=A0A518CQA0_9PLAN|nr:fatty acid CoA ligase family protein [Polystyrenella longa]QDU81395.1 Long-chain-fatty-acid--CoA ligase [Polystyrenella longa]